ncbi:zinc metallopeptidase, M23 family [Aliarcobacter faecis]|uniref:murein hydrolase activator EnvC family protein n=1 Tax=Aliarcobacter faecis TaxID=1564138 RepID=UPI0004794763|nr:M23 family metallopeptidase [Aliarcobacter faecis]QKF73112.1 zinc metallopeptidase, M23 family [Aliarcobacter faecis]
MIKMILTLFLSFYFIEASTIDKKIQQNKKQLDTTKQEEETKNIKIKELADKIEAQNSNISNLEKDIMQVNKDIDEHQKLLEESKSKLTELKTKSNKLIQEKTTNESQIVDTIVEEFSISIALNLASENSLQELIDNEIYTLLAQHSKDKVAKINNNYNTITNDSTTNQKDIEKISSYINDRQKTKDKLTTLKKQHSSSLGDLEKQHKAYQEELNKVVKSQENIKNLLSQLNILKLEEVKKAEEQAKAKEEAERKKKLETLMSKKNENNQKDESSSSDENEVEMQTADTRNQKFAKNLNLDVKKIGSSTDGVTITKYKGEKTIAPLKSFKIAKNFGTYYDPVYKIKLFNESIVLKSTEPQAKVVSVLSGKVVYAKKNAGMLDNVVIIQHEGGLHTIYSHLDDIAPTLVVGKWVQKGSVVGRVNESLSFQVTKDSSHIDPKELFNI